MADINGQVFDFSITDNSLVGLLKKINSFTDVGQGGILGIMILLIVGGVSFFMMRAKGGKSSAFAVMSVITFIVSVLLRILDLISDWVLYFCIVLLIVGLGLLVKESGSNEQ